MSVQAEDPRIEAVVKFYEDNNVDLRMLLLAMKKGLTANDSLARDVLRYSVVDLLEAIDRAVAEGQS